MSIPILKHRDILQTLIQADLTDQDLTDFRSELLDKVRETEAAGVIIDITSVEVVDSYMARAINETAHMVRLLGSDIVVCGMQPTVALTLVEMGRQLLGVATALNLDQGMEKIKRMIADRESALDPDAKDER